jgi:hypothetical protein
MQKERQKIASENPNYIPGIYNYCDRWCEKCSLNKRCMNFALEDEYFPDPMNMNNSALWEKLKEIFEDTIEMLKEISAQDGIDIYSPETNKTEQLKKFNLREKESIQSAKKYGTMVNVWFKKSNNLLLKKEEEIDLENSLDLPNMDTEGITMFNDAVDIIQWYQHFIYVKLSRAIDNELEKNEPDQPIRDSDGSAKISLISIDRSIAAWGILLKNLPESEDDILPILIHLNKLRSNIEQIFPNARKFIRPGFDDER